MKKILKTAKLVELNSFVIFGLGFLSVILMFLLPLNIIGKASALLLIPIILIVLLIGITISNKGEVDKPKKRSIIYRVPSNFAWIIRRSFLTDPGDPLYFNDHPKEKKEDCEAYEKRCKQNAKPKGYIWRREGYQFWIPVYHDDLDLVNLRPLQRNCSEVKVTTSDSQIILVDAQIITEITDPIRFVISMKGDTEEEKQKNREITENDLLHTAINRACSMFDSEELQAMVFTVRKDQADRYWLAMLNAYRSDFNHYQKKETINVGGETKMHNEDAQYWEDLTKKYNVVKSSIDGKEIDTIKLPIMLGNIVKMEMKKIFIEQQYGITVKQVGTQKVYTPDDIQEALQRERAAIIELRAAENEAAAMRKKIKETGADPTWVMISQTIADALRKFGTKRIDKE